jgi:hypothetical protein
VTPLAIIDIVRHLLDLVLDMVPAPVAQQMLSDAAVRRANLIADAAETAKFPEG